ncbi:MAG: glycosyltransferase family protein [Pseudolabrys sp.]|nr:glycosyltransferase family protein [Pseudolabrys sp.]
MTTAVIVQARMGSSRLPGKVMEEIEGRPVLAHVLDRCRAIKGCDKVVCAVPDAEDNKPLHAVARGCGADVFCGSEQDVLGRYLGAAKTAGADVIMRVTSDCPLIDPETCGAVLALRESEHADYAANNMPRSFPHGLDCEAFTAAALAEADASTHDPYDREHVTPWLRRAPHLRRANLSLGNPSLEEHRWTLDYPEDLEFVRAVFAALPQGSAGAMADVLKVIAAHPEIADINAMRRQPA